MPDDAWEVEARIVRPYLLTGGRTQPSARPLAVEAVVRATPSGRLAAPGMPIERRRIVALCAAPQSVAEVAVKLGLPLAVVRVLVADLCEEGFVTTGATRDPADDIDLLRRLIARVRAIPA